MTQVRGRTGIDLEPQLPSHFRTGTESLQKLEEALYKREEQLPSEETPQPPKFTVELKDCIDVQVCLLLLLTTYLNFPKSEIVSIVIPYRLHAVWLHQIYAS